MANYNRVILAGNLTRDVELRYTASGKAVADLGLAVNNISGAGETRREETTFVDCTAWEKAAQTIAQYLGKGSPILVEGRLRQERWQDQQGNNRSKLSVVVERFQFLGERGEGQQQRRQPPPATAPPSTPQQNMGIREGEIPF